MGGAGVRVYHHRGESVALRGREAGAAELERALASAAPHAAPATQLQLRRNHVGQLGKIVNCVFDKMSFCDFINYLCIIDNIPP